LEDYDIGIAIGRVIRKKRKELGLSIVQLAEKVEMDDKHLGKLERGERFPSGVTLIQILTSLEIKDPIIREIVYEKELIKKGNK
jgi:transcriptional regulator with XRE-family HTH domain